ncbi:hypothetical protein O1611_g8437 [Lasiodiplodia mahajangana]|uniref:Uncharacterized protein n=1 Tax=Lasiodiplodia mahajangana TaxID=1108764 RepID=A0ACC2JDB0_9PEZI|nr:hypothetical protein O1611_g8437 [Lasiodiplodia mahajangana]
MAKGTISKKRKVPSLHSRAARRATSPGIDTDKSLKNAKPPPESIDHRPSILAIHHDAGVSKKQKKGRALSSKARKRHEKAQDRAAAIMERTEKKVALSKGQSRTIQSRRKAWEEINHNSRVEPKGNARLEEDNTDKSEFDDEMGGAEEEGRNQQTSVTDKADVIGPATTTAMDQDDDDDGIL